MKVLDSDYDVDAGFFWIIVDGPHKDDKWTIQCCVSYGDEENPTNIIVTNDCGHDWGLCGDVNKKAFEYWGVDRCMRVLFDTAKKHGFQLEER